MCCGRLKQEPLSPRALYQLDQFLLRGGSLGVFITSSDMRSLKTFQIFFLEPLLGHYGVQVNRDLLVDRVNNGRMTFPIRYGNISSCSAQLSLDSQTDSSE